MSSCRATNANTLRDALEERARLYADGIDRLRELSGDLSEAGMNEVYDITFLFREAVELVRCLRRLADGRTKGEIHNAFGAPGDFGYETPIGAALARVYGCAPDPDTTGAP